MKYLVIFCIVLYVATATTARESDENEDAVDILSSDCCQYLRTNGFLIKYADLRELCPKTISTCTVPVPLGMQRNAIPDSKITASSKYNDHYKPSNARLFMVSRGWCPINRRIGEWLQVELREATKILGIATQGANGINEWVERFSLQYSNDGETFEDYESKKIFVANTDQNTPKWNKLDPPIFAKYIRVLPKTWHSWPAIRMELYGCK